MTPMNELVRTLHEGGFTLVMANGDDIRTFRRRGVADLVGLLDDIRIVDSPELTEYLRAYLQKHTIG